MHQNKSYLLTYINNIPYLIPYGQNIVLYRRSMRLNETGVFLWNALKEEKSSEDLLQAFCTHFLIPEAMKAEVAKDLETFLGQMFAYGAIEREKPEPRVQEPFYKSLQIAGLSINLHGDADCFSWEFDPFVSLKNEKLAEAAENAESTDLTIEVHKWRPPNRELGEIILRTEELWVIELEQQYQLLFPTSKDVHEARLSLDGSYAEIYCEAKADEQQTEDIFHVIRFLYLYKAQQAGIYAIHSASILYKGKAWLFSGHSGMGKSTHTNMWREIVQTPIINGDLNLISLKDGVPMAYGLPWCGTSGIASAKDYPLGGVILLARDVTDHVDSLEQEEQTLRLMQRMISPTWKKEQMFSCLTFAEELSRRILVKQLSCTKNETAVECCREEIDKYLDNIERKARQ